VTDKVLDRGSRNPRIQCGECGQWKRLHGRDTEGCETTRFYGSCEVTMGDHPCDQDVCSICCPTKCRERMGR
jgi:hypothetical protein